MKKIINLFKLLIILFLLIFFFFYAIAFNNALGWDLLLLCLLLVVIIFVSLLFPLKNVTISECQKMIVEVEQTQKVKLELWNTTVFFPLLVIKCKALNFKQSFPLFFKKRQIIEAEWTPENRGFIKELTFEIESNDLFGIISKCQIKKVPSELYALPKAFPESTDILDLFDSTINKNSLGEMSFELEKIRDYQPGDSAKQIDWKLSSKKEKLVYREYENNEKDKVLFLFYGTKSHYFEDMLRLFFSFYQRNQVSNYRFVLFGEGIKQESTIDLIDFCRIQNNEKLAKLPKFKEKQIVFFIPERSTHFENNLCELSAHQTIQVVDYRALKGRLML